jgi:hypothetical protein
MNKILYSLIQCGEMQYRVIIVQLSLIQKKYHTVYVIGLGKTGTMHLATVGY